MKKALLATIVALWASSAGAVELQNNQSSGNTEWLGFAVSPQGRVFYSDPTYDEDEAREAAISYCAKQSLRSCRAIAVPIDADVTVIKCQNGSSFDSFIGGSKLGFETDIAYDKAAQEGWSRRQCRVVFTY